MFAIIRLILLFVLVSLVKLPILTESAIQSKPFTWEWDGYAIVKDFTASGKKYQQPLLENMNPVGTTGNKRELIGHQASDNLLGQNLNTTPEKKSLTNKLTEITNIKLKSNRRKRRSANYCGGMMSALIKKKTATEEKRLEKLEEEWEDENCDINQKDRNGQTGDTLLHVAVNNSFLLIIRFLLSLGANPLIKNDHDISPFDTANRMEPVNPQMVSLLQEASNNFSSSNAIPEECVAPPKSKKSNLRIHNAQELLEVLNDGEQRIEISDNKDVVLILGMTGSGKTTFTQMIAGNAENLNSVMVSETDFIIVDKENKISRDITISKTLIPELVLVNNSIAIYDCPGFSDTRSAYHDIAVSYFIKKALSHTRRVKLLFLVVDSALRQGVAERGQFMDLLKHATNFVKNVDKFNDSIALVVTKVASYDNNGFPLLEGKIKKSVAEFLKGVKGKLLNNTETTFASVKKVAANKSMAAFLDILLTKEKISNTYSKIGISQIPNECGFLNKIEFMTDKIKALQNFYINNLNYTEKNDEDFGFSLSPDSQNIIIDVTREINLNITILAKSIMEGLKAESRKNEYNIYGYETNLIKNTMFISEKVRQLKNNSQLTSELFTKEITNLFISTQIEMNKSPFDLLTNQSNYFSALALVYSNNSNDLKRSPSEWIGPLDELVNNLNEVQFKIFDAASKINFDIMSITQVIVENVKIERSQSEFSLYEYKEKLTETIHYLNNKIDQIKNSDNMTPDIFRKNLQVMLTGVDINLKPSMFLQLMSISKDYSELEYLFSHQLTKLPTSSKEWIQPVEELVKNINKKLTWYDFIVNLHNQLSSYSVQYEVAHNRSAIKEVYFRIGKPLTYYESSLSSYIISEYIHSVENYEEIKNWEIGTEKFEELSMILNYTLYTPLEITCNSDGLVVKGNYVVLSKVSFEREFIQTAKCVHIFAADRVYIDTSVHETGNEINYIIMAPHWEIIGNQEIILNGKEGLPHRKTDGGIDWLGNGNDGKIGNAGGNAGNFLGFAMTIKNKAFLFVSAVGGKGGPGQIGGKGRDGKDGREPYADPDCERCNCRGKYCKKFKCTWEVTKTHDITNDCYDLHTCYLYTIEGDEGKKGGRGGHGGKGGIAGRGGAITLLEIGNSGLVFRNMSNNGEIGKYGEGGAGGRGGKHAGRITASQMVCFFVNACTHEKIFRNYSFAHNGTKGSDNFIGNNDLITAPSKVFNYYLSFVGFQEFLLHSFENNPVKGISDFFLQKIQTMPVFRKLRNTVGLYSSLLSLEQASESIKNMNYLLPSYKSLLDEILDYSQNLNNDEMQEKPQYIKCLSYLYTTTFSKIISLSHSIDSSLVIDLEGFLDTTTDNIKKLEKASSNQVVIKYNSQYKSDVDNKIEQGLSFIASTILPELDIMSEELEKQVGNLLRETLEIKNLTEDSRKDLYKSKAAFQNTMALRTLFSALNMVGMAVSFLGPKGAAVGATLNVVTMVGQSLALSGETTKQGIMSQKALPSGVTNLHSNVQTTLSGRKDKAIAKLDNKLKECEKELLKSPDELSDLSAKVARLQKEALEYKKSFGVDLTTEKLEKELNQAIFTKKEALTEKFKTSKDEKTKQALRIINRLSVGVKFGETAFQAFSNHQQDSIELNEFDRNIKETSQKIKVLEEFEEKIYSEVGPLMKNLNIKVQEYTKEIETQSPINLDVSKWKVQQMIRNIKFQIKEITEGFKIQPKFLHYIQNLEEGMNIIIQIYDRIQSYEDTKRTADYMANLNSPSAIGIAIENEELKTVIANLDLKIQSNVFLTQQNRAMQAFKQWVFPFAHLYMKEFTLPENILTSKNSTSLIHSAIRNIESIKSKIRNYKTTIIEKHDKHIFTEDFVSESPLKPFYTWDNSEFNQESIKALLAGNEVGFKADITQSDPLKDAIKFTRIGIEIKSSNVSEQQNLNNMLENFEISMSYLGSSYYRCKNEFYIMSNEKLTITYAFKMVNGVPISFNGVYKKMSEGNFMLSPYAMWQLKIKSINRNVNFNDLKEFGETHNVFLELVGKGFYTKTAELSEEELSLKKYYKVDNTVLTSY